MGIPVLSGRTVLVATAGAALVAGASAAAADTTPVPLFVNNLSTTGCSDTGPGTEARPYCTIGAGLAVAVAGQTVNVAPGAYHEHLSFPRSGEPGRPITLHATGPAPMTLTGGPDVGVTINGRHDLVVDGVRVVNAANGPAVDVTDSAHISLQNITAQLATEATGTSVRLAGVTDSSLVNVDATGTKNTVGIALDAGTSGVLVTKSHALATREPGGRAIEIRGSRNTLLGNSIRFGGSASVALLAGAADNVLVNNDLSGAEGIGIDNTDATGTVITNNTVYENCLAGIRIAGASTGVSVQNNVVHDGGPAPSGSCSTANAVEIGVFDGAVGHTVVDYNSVFHNVAGASNLYAWNGTVLGLTAFRAASGQGAHDADGLWTDTSEDSANSAAPGWPSTDYNGAPREDNPKRPNVGAGPVPYADRGNTEAFQGPLATLTLHPDYAANSITADASGSTPGNTPIVSYSFQWGDTTTTTQATPIATHHYAKPGTYWVIVSVTDSHGHSSQDNRSASLWPTVRTIALMSHDNNRYVTSGTAGSSFLTSNVYTGSVGLSELYEVVEPGNGHVALRSPINGNYVYVNQGTQPLLSAGDAVTDDDTLFDLTTNADGTISLWAVAKKAYVSSNSGSTQILTADRAAIGPWEQFGVVKQADAGLTLKAHANNKYVTAENGGASPLIANRLAAGLWETYDLVDAGGGYVALYSHANGKYVTAENAGSSPLIARSTAVGLWEKFKIVKNADGSISLLANANGKYVTAENGGNSALIARATTVGLWEEFN